MSEDPYVPCPRCRGRKLISVIIRAGTPWSPTVSDYVDCPLCCGTGEAERDSAANWVADQQETDT